MASGNRTDISLDDPNFWDKWAKKADIDMEMVNGRVRAATRTHHAVRLSVRFSFDVIVRTLASHRTAW